MSSNNANVNYSETLIINNKKCSPNAIPVGNVYNPDSDTVNNKPKSKPMRISALQKWVLQNVRLFSVEKMEAVGELTGFLKLKISMPYSMPIQEIIHKYFKIAWPEKKLKRKATVIVTRSLKTMQEHGLIVRIGFLTLPHMPRIVTDEKQLNACREKARLIGNNPTEEQKQVMRQEINKAFTTRKEPIAIPMLIEGGARCAVRTKLFLLTDKGIELRMKLMKEAESEK